MKKYTCHPCNYKTDKIFNFKAHLKTKKHMTKKDNNNTINKLTQKNEYFTQKNEYSTQKNEYKNPLQCSYCNKTFSRKQYVTRHHPSCKKKRKYEEMLKIENEQIMAMIKAKEEEEKATMAVKKEKKRSRRKKKLKAKYKELEKKFREIENKSRVLQIEKNEVEREFLDFMKKTSLSAKTINNNTYNMYYIINNFTDAHDYKELMNKPMNQIEKDEIYRLGPNQGCIKYIKNRCIDNISVEKRPIHCVDSARNKYLLRENGSWIIDNGEKILKEAYKNIKNVYLIKFSDNNYIQKIDELNDKMKQLVVIETKGKVKVLGILNNLIMLKNNIDLPLPIY